MTYLNYIMINSGSTQKIRAGDIDGTLVAMAHIWLEREGMHQGFIPGLPLDLLVTRKRSSAFCTVQAQGVAIAEIGMAKRSIDKAWVWDALHYHEEDDAATAGMEPPHCPWVAVRLLPSIGRHPQGIALTVIAVAKCCGLAMIDHPSEH